jgi:16S rRNA (cytosine967-C5)-methyltransferase
MHYDSYLRTCELILKNYNCKIPFAAWLKDFFRQDKKYGSRDRRTISHFCYSFFRLGKAFESKDIPTRIMHAVFLSAKESSHFLERYTPALNNFISEPIEKKLEIIDAPEEEWKNIFPFENELSNSIDPFLFAVSHLQQPDLFVRVRPGRENKVHQKLTEAGIPFESCDAACISLPNGAPVDTVLDLDADAVVQDRNSQLTMELLLPHIKKGDRVWDCCAASGGKSMLLYDKMQVDLTVSDKRTSILVNLERRFGKAGIKNYRSFVTDLSGAYAAVTDQFDAIICDAPCSGSGTWGRNPEQLRFFPENKIDSYSDLQKKIAGNAAERLKPGGYFLYITCSVFSKENEDVVAWLEENTSMKLEASGYLKGYEQKSDTLFTALFRL